MRKRAWIIALFAVLLAFFAVQWYRLAEYRDFQRKAKEAVLIEDLQRIRELIAQYHEDKQRYPRNLDTLVDEGYLRKLPVDPITGRADTWVLRITTEGMTGVSSGATGTTLTGIPYGKL